MKYIRTNEGIYEVVDTYETKYVVGYTEDGFEKVVYKENIIAEADTIEELCDEFVIIPKNDWGKNYLAYGVNTKFLKESIYNLNYPIKDVYGAIWTDKGLIYVAKMNKDGKFELI